MFEHAVRLCRDNLLRLKWFVNLKITLSKFENKMSCVENLSSRTETNIVEVWREKYNNKLLLCQKKNINCYLCNNCFFTYSLSNVQNKILNFDWVGLYCSPI